MLKKYFKVWYLMARNAFAIWLTKRGVLGIFLIGKVIRLIFYYLFLYLLVRSTSGIAGYGQNEILFFASTYILIDTLAQFFYRSVYGFRPLVVTGDLDLILVKPLNPLFRVLMGGADMIDLITLPPIIFLVCYLGSLLVSSPLSVFYYVLLVINGLIIATAFHIAVLSLGILTLEVDHTIMIYRDLVSMGRVPVDIYKEPFKTIITYLIPVGVMVTIPAKSFMGLVSFPGVISSFLFGISLLMLSFVFWRYALKKYSSASS